MHTRYIEYLKKLVSFESITPKSNGAIEYLATLLKQHGFKTEIKVFGSSLSSQVTNLYAVFGNTKPNVCFIGHVDVVPAGDLTLWNSSPFTMHIDGDKIYGRGTVDMKGAIACFLTASLDFIKNISSITGAISFLITSDEEGEAKHGTQLMLPYIYDQNQQIDFAIVGEPTCEQEIGDTIKIGRRGSINFKLTIEGVAGHVAYPHQANNPLPSLIKIMQHLTTNTLDKGTKFFSHSNLEITSIDVGNTISNIIPNRVSANFNIRFNDLHTSQNLITNIEKKIKAICEKHNLNYNLDSSCSTESFIQQPNDKIVKFADIVENTLNIKPKFSTSGGTSDARFVKNYCPLVEFGLLSTTAHKINEHTKITDLQKLYNVYYAFLNKCLS